MVRKTSSFLGSRTCMFGTSLASPQDGHLPNSKMVWASTVAPATSLASGDQSWPAGDLDNFNRWIALIGRRPDSVRLYSNNPSATTGTAGSAGAYGFITSDMRAIANTGTALCITFKLGDANQWAAQTTALTSTGTNETKTKIANIAQNIRRWRTDTGNTATIKKLMMGMHHEPSNDGQTGPIYVSWWQAIVDELATHGIGDGPAPSGYTGAAAWLDCIEYTFVDIGTTFSGGTNPYYPGFNYVTWVLADPYNWAGGMFAAVSATGKVPQIGDNIKDPLGGLSFNPNSHYAQNWSTFKDTVQNILSWTTNNPDILAGLGEFSTSCDVDRWTPNSAGVLQLPKTNTGVPLAGGEWYRQIPRVCQGLASETDISALNASTADSRATRLKLITAWPSQEKMPRWINQKAWMPGDVATPSSTHTAWNISGTQVGHIDTSMLDGFKYAANHSWFAPGTTGTEPPSDLTITVTTDAGAPLFRQFDGTAVAGSSSISTYEWSFGDSSAAETGQSVSHTYAAGGTFTVTLTVTDSAGGSAAKTKSVTVTDEGGPPAESDFGFRFILPDGADQIADFRLIYNPNLVLNETLLKGVMSRLTVLEGGSGGTIGAPVLGALVEDATAVASTSVPYPSAGAGLLVAFMSHATTATVTNPAGWTQVYNSNRGGSLPTLWVGIKVASGSESGSLAIAHGSSAAMGRMMRVPGVNTTTPQDVAATTVSHASGQTTTVLPTLITTGTGRMLVAIAAHNGAAANADSVAGPGTWTEDADRVSGARTATMWHSLWSGSGGTGAVTITWSGSATSHGVLLALRPA